MKNFFYFFLLESVIILFLNWQSNWKMSLLFTVEPSLSFFCVLQKLSIHYKTMFLKISGVVHVYFTALHCVLGFVFFSLPSNGLSWRPLVGSFWMRVLQRGVDIVNSIFLVLWGLNGSNVTVLNSWCWRLWCLLLWLSTKIPVCEIFSSFLDWIKFACF